MLNLNYQGDDIKEKQVNREKKEGKKGKKKKKVEVKLEILILTRKKRETGGKKKKEKWDKIKVRPSEDKITRQIGRSGLRIWVEAGRSPGGQ